MQNGTTNLPSRTELSLQCCCKHVGELQPLEPAVKQNSIRHQCAAQLPVAPQVPAAQQASLISSMLQIRKDTRACGQQQTQSQGCLLLLSVLLQTRKGTPAAQACSEEQQNNRQVAVAVSAAVNAEGVSSSKCKNGQ
jgi:hypothetical protein